MNENSLPEQLVANIIQKQMALPDGSIWIGNENKLIPNDNGLYVSVNQIYAKVVGNVRTDIPTDGGMDELVQIITRETLQIDIFSADLQALNRRWEIIMALMSVYCEQVQELNNFSISSIPTNFTNTSGAEGGSFINRFTANINVLSWYRAQTAIPNTLGDYYDDFKTSVVTDDNPSGGQPYVTDDAGQDEYTTDDAGDNVLVDSDGDNQIAEFEITPETNPPFPPK